MNPETLKQFIALDARRKALDAELKDVTGRLEAMREPLLDQWIQEGVTSLKVDGHTVSLRRQVWARVVDRERIADALRREGLESLLTPNSQQLSAWVREREAEGQPLPASFAGVVDTFERFSLSVRGNGTH